MVNTEIRLIIFFAAKDGEALYSQQKQDQELTVAHHELLIVKFRLKLKKVGKTTGEGNGTPLQHSCLENPMDGGAWCPWGCKELDTIERLHFLSFTF